MKIVGMAGGWVRVFERDGQSWYVLSDVIQAFQLNSKPVIQGHIGENEVKFIQAHVKDDTTEKKRGYVCRAISINAVVKLAFCSSSPKIMQFIHWVTKDLLPKVMGGSESFEDCFADCLNKSVFPDTDRLPSLVTNEFEEE